MRPPAWPAVASSRGWPNTPAPFLTRAGGDVLHQGLTSLLSLTYPVLACTVFQIWTNGQSLVPISPRAPVPTSCCPTVLACSTFTVGYVLAPGLTWVCDPIYSLFVFM